MVLCRSGFCKGFKSNQEAAQTLPNYFVGLHGLLDAEEEAEDRCKTTFDRHQTSCSLDPLRRLQRCSKLEVNSLFLCSQEDLEELGSLISFANLEHVVKFAT